MDRKKFLKTVPLIGIGSYAAFSGCSTGGTVDSGEGTDLTGDNLILTQAAEREAIAIRTYTAAAESGLITNQDILDAAISYRDHHGAHLALFNNLLVEGEASTINVDDFAADQRINNVSDQEEAILLAMTLEMEAANFYFTSSVRDLQSPIARETVGSILPIEVSHFVFLKAAIGRNPAINSAIFTELSQGN